MTLIPGTILARRLAIACAVLVVIASSYPEPGLHRATTGYIDKLLHFAEFLVLSFLVSRGWGPLRQVGRGGVAVWIPAMILLAFAAIDEYHQHWIPGRSPEWFDWTADAAGVIIGYALGALANRVAARKPDGRTEAE